MTGSERVRKLRETAQILETLFMTITMYRALATDVEDRLNFFRIYKSILMDASVIAWCKVFGSHKDGTHWKKVLSKQGQDLVRAQLHELLGGETKFKELWFEIKTYRDTYISHHDLNEDKRATHHPYLSPLFETAKLVYCEMYEELKNVGETSGIMPPEVISEPRVSLTEERWRDIANAARKATMQFKE